MTRRWVGALATACLLSSCGGAQGTSGVAQYLIRFRTDLTGQQYTIDAPPERVAETLPDVYRHLGLPGGRASNIEETLIISPALRVKGLLYEGSRNSEYLDCGSGIRGLHADSRELEFVVVTRVTAGEDGGTVIETILDGFAEDRFHNVNRAPCRGTDKLAGEIAEVLRFMIRNNGPEPFPCGVHGSPLPEGLQSSTR